MRGEFRLWMGARAAHCARGAGPGYAPGRGAAPAVPGGRGQRRQISLKHCRPELVSPCGSLAVRTAPLPLYGRLWLTS